MSRDAIQSEAEEGDAPAVEVPAPARCTPSRYGQGNVHDAHASTATIGARAVERKSEPVAALRRRGVGAPPGGRPSQRRAVGRARAEPHAGRVVVPRQAKIAAQ